MTATGTASIAVPKLKLGVRDAAKVEQGRARQATATKTELTELREHVATLERALHETKQETDQAAVEQVYSLARHLDTHLAHNIALCTFIVLHPLHPPQSLRRLALTRRTLCASAT